MHGGRRVARGRGRRAHDRPAVVRGARGRRAADPDGARRDPVDRPRRSADRCRHGVRGRMNVDVFTLFPAWFEWFREQRHVANALALGHTFDCIDPRETTPLKWGQVDDTPFGGGAGMVLRVDVIEAALRARYGTDPVSLRSQRRVIALTPAGRLLDDSLAGELAGEQSITLLC